MKITQKLLALVSIVSIIGVLLIGVISFIFTRSAFENSIGDSQLQLTEQTMDKIDRLLYERYNDVQTIAGDQTIENFLAHESNANNTPVLSGDIKRRVNELAVVTGPWDDIDVVDTQGIIQYSIDPTAIGKDIQNEPEHIDVFYKALQGSVESSDAFIDPDLQKPTIMFGIPIHDENDPQHKIVGVVVTHLSWPVITEVLES